jgi:hypothetical protein
MATTSPIERKLLTIMHVCAENDIGLTQCKKLMAAGVFRKRYIGPRNVRIEADSVDEWRDSLPTEPTKPTAPPRRRGSTRRIAA